MKYNTLSFGTHREKAKQDVVWLLQTDFLDQSKSEFLYFLQIRSPKHLDRIYDILTKITLARYGEGPFYSVTPMQVYNDVKSLLSQLGLRDEEYSLIESLSGLT